MKRMVYPLMALAATAAAAETAPLPLAAAESSATPQQELALPPAEETPEKATGVFAAFNAGTQGIGVDLGYEFNSYLKLRLRGSYLSYDYKTTWDGANASLKLNGNNAGLLLDVHPFANRFRISAGFNFNPLSVEAQSTLSIHDSNHSGIYTWGDYDYRVTKGTGWAKARYKWHSVQPYLGIGWASGSSSGLYFSCDLGVNFMGRGSFSVSNSDNVQQSPVGKNAWVPVNNSLLKDSIIKEGQAFFKIADNLIVYPVLQLGLGYSF